jgi:L-iditol 2-dehydrogenase
MRALAYRGAGQLVPEDRPVPRPGPGEVVLRVDACGICGTDLRIAAGAHGAYAGAGAAGRIPGHEVAGTVAEAGRGAAATVGERVFVAPNYGCGRCRQCQRGQAGRCASARAIGITEDGGLAGYLLLPAALVAQGNLLRAGVADPAAVALAEPLACALRGSRACGTGPGDVVLICGAGPVGLLHVALARLAGAAAVLVADPHPGRRARALAWGAASAHDTGAAELRAALAAVGADGADVVIVAAPAPLAQQQALELAAAGGRILLFAGLPRDASRVELDTNLVHYKELVVTGTTGSSTAECRDALELITTGQVDTGALIDARLDLSAARDALDLVRSRQVTKAVIVAAAADAAGPA